MKRTHAKAGEAPEHFVVISRQIHNLRIPGDQASDVLHYLHMRLGPEPFRELPHVDNVSVEDQSFRANRFEVAKQGFRVTSICSEVNIRQYDEVDVSFSLFAHGV